MAFSPDKREEKEYIRQKDIIEKRRDWLELYEELAKYIKCINEDTDELVRFLEQLKNKILKEVRKSDEEKG